MGQHPASGLSSALKWVLIGAGAIFVLLLIDTGLDLASNGFIDARDVHFRMDERTFPSPDGRKSVQLVIFHEEPRSTSMMLDHGRSGCGIFSYPDTGLSLEVRWVDDEHVWIIGPESLRTGMNLINDTCQSFRDRAYVSFHSL